MQGRTCTRSATHAGHLILGICLQEICEDHSLVCKLCAKEHHQGHLVVTLNYLKQSYQNAKNTQEFNQLIKHFGQEEEKLQKMALEASQSFVEVSTRIHQKVANEHPFIQLLSTSFQRLQMPQIVNYVSSSRSLPPQTLKNFLPVLRLYYFQGGYQLTSLKEDNLQVVKHFTELFSKAENDIKSIIFNLEENIINYTLRHNVRPEPMVKEEHQELEMRGQKASVQHQTTQGRMVFRQRIDVEQKITKEEEITKSEAERHKQTLKKANLSRDQSEEITRVILRQSKDVKINTLIFYIDVTKIKELTLSNSASTCVVNKESAEHISKMVYLNVLRMFWVKDLTDVQACTMLKNMQDLKELSLCQFEACSPLFINALKINNPRLRKLNFSIDLQHFLRFNEENIEFLPDSAYHYQEEQAWLTFASGLRDLGTLELHHPQNKHFWCKFIKNNAAKLLEFTLSNIDQTQGSRLSKKNKDYNYSPLMRYLQDSKNLRALRFEQVHFDEKHLIRIIESNPKLISFMANECSNITNRTYQAIGRCSKEMEELAIQMNDEFSIESIENVKSLKTLIIRGCWGIKEAKFIEVISKLPNIKCLSLDYNFQWLTAKSIKILGMIPHLKVLSISGNNITSADVQALNYIPYLNTLICSNNNFSYTDLLKCPFAKTLKKLSISKNKATYPKECQPLDLSVLVEAFPSLTHLKLKGMKNIRPAYLELLPRLICLTVIDTQESDLEECRDYCKQNEIYFNENREEEE